MKRKNTQHINDLIRQYAKSVGKEDEYLQAKIINNWSNIFGNAIANYTKKVYFYEGKIFIKLTSPALKQEMIILREHIQNKINIYAGKKIVNEIVFL